MTTYSQIPSRYTDGQAIAAVESEAGITLADFAAEVVADVEAESGLTLAGTEARIAGIESDVSALELAVLSVSKTTDETVNNSDTLQNDDELVVQVEANARYGVELVVRGTSPSSSPQIKMGWSLPSGASIHWIAVGDLGGSGTPELTGASTETIAPNNNNIIQKLIGVLQVGGTAGNLQFQWAQNTATAEDTKVLAGSNLTLTKG